MGGREEKRVDKWRKEGERLVKGEKEMEKGGMEREEKAEKKWKRK